MAASKILAPLCLMVLVFGLCLSTVKSHSYDVCAGVERPDPETIPCTINCILPDFVCGTDGVTYTCGCLDAFCHGVDVVKKGKWCNGMHAGHRSRGGQFKGTSPSCKLQERGN
ncbi:hypothetical protein DKX38_021125 [Salix brachista]|uniref:Kazal-like domain-containing protein n=1 Tax=Salix brachista TaxID=2182728 RepID=A0A5N5K763_9ROSI|nr:hypothetical protein DKX38_021125 [Salix brachista]